MGPITLACVATEVRSLHVGRAIGTTSSQRDDVVDGCSMGLATMHTLIYLAPTQLALPIIPLKDDTLVVSLYLYALEYGPSTTRLLSMYLGVSNPVLTVLCRHDGGIRSVLGRPLSCDPVFVGDPERST
jgi:hypothetical protein